MEIINIRKNNLLEAIIFYYFGTKKKIDTSMKKLQF